MRGLARHRPNAGRHRGDEVDVAVDDERRRHGGEGKDDERDDRPDPVADEEEGQAVCGGEDVGEELRERRDVDAVEHQEQEDREIQPDDEGEEADEGEPAEVLAGAVPDRARAPGRPRQRLAGLEPARDLVGSRRAEGREQGEAHHERIGEIVIAGREGDPEDQPAADRVDGAEEHAVFRRAAEIPDALCDALHQIGDVDLADLQWRRLPVVRGGAAGRRRPGVNHNRHWFTPMP